MPKNKLSANSFLKKINKSKYINKLNKISIDELEINEKDFLIENLNIDNGDNYVQNEILKKLLNSFSSCQISDALNNLTGRNGVLNGLKPINNMKTHGIIVTAITNSDDWGTSLLAIDKAKKGEIILILSKGKPSAVWGELTSRCSKEKGLAGTIIYGAIRDIDFVKNFNYPLFASYIAPNAGKPVGLGRINNNVKIENTEIKPGDFLFADQSGVVSIPRKLFSKVMLETFKIKVKESQIISKINEGKSLSEILNLK